jgi:hypothetical protein
MPTRWLFIILAVAALSVTSGTPALPLGMDEDVKGLITRIDEGEITLKDFMGVEKTIELRNPEALSEFKVGDRAEVKEGILLPKEGSGTLQLVPRY